MIFTTNTTFNYINNDDEVLNVNKKPLTTTQQWISFIFSVAPQITIPAYMQTPVLVNCQGAELMTTKSHYSVGTNRHSKKDEV